MLVSGATLRAAAPTFFFSQNSLACARMAPYRAGNHEYAFIGTAGDARTLNAAFLRSLIGAGLLRVHSDHWLNSVMPGSLTPTGDPSLLLASLRLIIYLFFPSLLFTGALDAMALPFFPHPDFISRFLHELLTAGMASTPCSDWREVRNRISTSAKQLPAASCSIDAADVRRVAIDDCWLTALTPALLRGSSSTNDSIISFMMVLPDCFVAVDTPSALLGAALSMLTPPSVPAAAPAILIAVRAAAHAAITAAEPPFDFFLPYSDIMVELARRLEDSEETRYRPLFDRHFLQLYPKLASAFPACLGASEMRQLVSTVMLSFGLRSSLSHSAVLNVCNLLTDLLPALNLESSAATSTSEQRVATLSKLFREQSSARASSKEGKSDGPEVERYDKLLGDPSYLDLYTKVMALNTDSFDVAGAVTLLANHAHPAGLIVLTTSRTPQQSAWAQILGVRQKTSWPSIFDVALSKDYGGVAQPGWGRMLPFDKTHCPTANHLMQGKLDLIKDWWTVCSTWVEKYEGKHVCLQFPALADSTDFWFDSVRLRLVDTAMTAIFAAIGHDQSRSTPGSFREFYARQITRAEHISRIPCDVALFPDLMRRAKFAVSLVFSQYAESHAAMLTRPLHLAQRVKFLDPSGSPATALTEIDDELVRVRSELARAAEGRAAFQASHLLQSAVAPSSSETMQAPAATISRGQAVTSLRGAAGKSTPHAASAYPAGVFKMWGNQAVRHGAWMNDHGLVFGNRQVTLKNNTNSVTFAHCMAAAGPNGSARGNSAWCVTPDQCKLAGYAAHERVEGTTDDDYVVTDVPDDADRSKWKCVVAPAPALIKVAPPDPPWSIFHGPAGDSSGASPKSASGNSRASGKKPLALKGRGVSKTNNKKSFDGQSSRRKTSSTAVPNHRCVPLHFAPDGSGAHATTCIFCGLQLGTHAHGWSPHAYAP